jgi:hypothetical protein
MGVLDRFYDMQWWVAVRPHMEDGYLDTPMDFRVLKNTWRYWCADPFAFDHDGKTYLFMEVFDKTTQKGAIGYRVIDRGKVSGIRICLNTGDHMSYPMIYRANGQIYMIPECFESNRLTVYRAVEFPDRWEPCEVLPGLRKVCDTNYLAVDGQEYLLTMPLHGQPFQYDQLELYIRRQGKWESADCGPMTLGADRARNGGHFFRYKGEWIRPSQNCAASYGEALNLNKVTKLSPDGYEETLWNKITVADIRTDREGFDGIHTFNHSASYDVIDLRKLHSFQFARLFYFIRNKLRRKS